MFDYFLRSQTTTASNGTSRRHSQDGMEGSTIIALFPSQKWGSAEDEIIIIVAHWDTVKDSSGSIFYSPHNLHFFPGIMFKLFWKQRILF